jgi:hypothetical protein
MMHRLARLVIGYLTRWFDVPVNRQAGQAPRRPRRRLPL